MLTISNSYFLFIFARYNVHINIVPTMRVSYETSNPEQISELNRIQANMGNPMDTLAKNVRYLIDKYSVKVNDFCYHYKTLALNPKSLYNLKMGKKRSVSPIYVMVVANYFNEAFNAGLTLADMYTDLEQRDAFENLTKNK